MISLFLHLNEAEKEVVDAVKGTLKQLAPLIEAPSLAEYVVWEEVIRVATQGRIVFLGEADLSHLPMICRALKVRFKDDYTLHYGEFLNDISRILVRRSHNSQSSA